MQIPRRRAARDDKGKKPFVMTRQKAEYPTQAKEGLDGPPDCWMGHLKTVLRSRGRLRHVSLPVTREYGGTTGLGRSLH
jgi:hypothetical protein